MDFDKALREYITLDETPFCLLFDLTHSDKGYRWHQYSRLYYSLMKPLRDQEFNLFELGIGTNNVNIPSNMGAGGRPGASLFAWVMYFKRAHIYAADIDRNILDNSVPRIRTFYCDQTDPQSVNSLWENPLLKDKKFQIIIDDGLHLPHANLNFFEHSIHMLDKGGVFIIEDIDPQYSDSFLKLLEVCKEKYPHLDCRYILVETSTDRKPVQNYVFLAHYKN
jgi:hypothetical protein